MADAEQLALPLPVRAALGEADFLVTDSNREAVAWLDAWPEWPGRSLLLHGPHASGKSHLLAIWCKRANAALVHGAALTMETAVGATGHVAIDDADKCEPRLLFHLINQVKAAGGSLLLTASAPAAEWPAALPDLLSRLNAMPGARLAAPDDALLTGLAAKLFHDRQITVPDRVLNFMMPRLERSCAAVAEAVEKLDRAAWAEQRALTVPLARKILDLDTNPSHEKPDQGD